MPTPGTRPPRILHVIGSFDGGGAERVLLTVLQGLRDCDQALAIAGSGALLPMVPSRVQVLPARTEVELATLMTRFQPDIVHTWLDGSLLLAVAPAAHLGIPLVHRLYNTPPMQKIYEPGGPGHNELMSRALSVARVIALTPTIADDAAGFYGIARPQVIFNGLPLAGRRDAGPASVTKTRGRFVILNTGRLAPQKGQAFLIEAFARIARRHAHVDLWIAGVGQLEGELQALAAALGVAGRVQFLGFHEDVTELLRAADIFAFPSVFEGFGNALAEALAAGVPVIASDLPVIRRDVLDGAPAALLVAPGDVTALAQALDGLIADPARRTELSDAARKAGSRFRVDRMLAEYREFYARVMEDVRAAA